MKTALSVLALFYGLGLVSCDEETLRVDCTPDTQISSPELCQSRGCTWSPPTEDTAAPSCFFPPDYGYVGQCRDVYQVDGGLMVNLTKSGTNTLFGKDFQNITIFWEFQTRTRIRVKIFPSNVERYEVPLTIEREEELTEDDLDVWLECDDDPVLSWRLVRKDSGSVLFDSSLGGLTVSDQFLQIAGLLPSENIYGFAEQEQPSFRHDLNWRSWGMFARDHAPEGDANLYGVHPRYTVLEKDGQESFKNIFSNRKMSWLSQSKLPIMMERSVEKIFV